MGILLLALDPFYYTHEMLVKWILFFLVNGISIVAMNCDFPKCIVLFSMKCEVPNTIFFFEL